jgi:hypothetical protein
MGLVPMTSPTRTGDVLLLIGVGLFVGGLTVFAGGLRGFDGSSGGAGADILTIGINDGVRISGRGPLETAEPVTDEIALFAMSERDPGPSRSRPTVPIPHDRPVMSHSTAVQGDAGWSERWYSTILGAEIDGRDYLARTANARLIVHWYQMTMGWGESSGYAAIEASRATQDIVVETLGDRSPRVASRNGR